MATTFRNKVIKDIGTQKIIAIETNGSTRSTIIGISLANLTEFPAYVSILIHDDTSVEGYYLWCAQIKSMNNISYSSELFN